MTQTGFDDKYGDGALARLTRMLEQPCVTFAQIAGEFSAENPDVDQIGALMTGVAISS